MKNNIAFSPVGVHELNKFLLQGDFNKDATALDVVSQEGTISFDASRQDVNIPKRDLDDLLRLYDLKLSAKSVTINPEMTLPVPTFVAGDWNKDYTPTVISDPKLSMKGIYSECRVGFHKGEHIVVEITNTREEPIVINFGQSIGAILLQKTGGRLQWN